MKKMKCVACEEKFDLDKDGGLIISKGEHEGDYLCENCYQDDSDPVATIVYFDSEGKKEIRKYDYHDDSFNDELPAYVELYLNSIKYHATDGWRGYYEGKAPAGFELIKDTWFCSLDGHNMDDFMFKIEGILKSDEIPPVELIISFTRTSNVFSTGLDVYVRQGDKNILLEWLGVSLENE